MASKLDRYVKSIPKELKPQFNPILNALLRAFASSDEEVMEQLRNTRAQLFVKTSEGVFLDRLASNVGVSRPSALGLLDEDFQKLIPNLSFKAKQIAKSFYDTMDVFWGPKFSRANTNSGNSAPFNVTVGESFTVTIDGGTPQTFTILEGDIATSGAATANEMVRVLSRVIGLTATIERDPATGAERVNIRTNTPGPRGSLEIESGSLTGMGYRAGVKHKVTDLAQRTVLYQMEPGELVIELPAIVPSLRRTLKGSHHFHLDATIEEPIAPATKPWQGSFLYSFTQNPFIVTSRKGRLQRAVLKGSVVSEIVLDDSTAFPAEGGQLIFNFGKSNQEQPVSFITVPNSKTILVDPGHTFAQTHAVDSEVNLIIPQNTPLKPRKNGDDLAIYMTSPGNSRLVVQELLRNLAAAGIKVTFIVLLPTYRYLKTNPYA